MNRFLTVSSPNRSRASSLLRIISANVAVKCSSAAVIARLDFFGANFQRSARPIARHLLDLLRRIAQLGEAIVQHAVLAAVDRLLADEPADLALQGGVGDLVAVVADRLHEEVLAVGEHGGEASGNVAGDEVAVFGEMLGDGRDRVVERRSGASEFADPGCWSALLYSSCLQLYSN